MKALVPPSSCGRGQGFPAPGWLGLYLSGLPGVKKKLAEQVTARNYLKLNSNSKILLSKWDTSLPGFSYLV